MSFEDQISLLVDVEWSNRQNNKLDRMIKAAGLRYNHGCIEDIEYYPDRRLDKAILSPILPC